MKRTLLSLFLMVVCMAVSAASGTATISNVKYYYYSSGSYSFAYVTGYEEGLGATVTIPATITVDEVSYTVLGFDDDAFKGNTTLTSVTLENTGYYVYLYDSVFEGCTNLTTFATSTPIARLGESTFKGCAKMTRCGSGSGWFDFRYIGEFPESVFEGCVGLRQTQIYFSYVTNIGSKAFANCVTSSEDDYLFFIHYETTAPTVADDAFENPGEIDHYVPAADHASFVGVTGLTSGGASNYIVPYWFDADKTDFMGWSSTSCIYLSSPYVANAYIVSAVHADEDPISIELKELGKYEQDGTEYMIVPSNTGVILEITGNGKQGNYFITGNAQNSSFDEYMKSLNVAEGNLLWPTSTDQTFTNTDTDKYLLVNGSGDEATLTTSVAAGGAYLRVMNGQAVDVVTDIKSIAKDLNDNSPWYNINGVKVDKPGKGIYIHNGKKFIFK